jgi:hypothetical protein
MIVSIHQPNFFPWYGYFQKISNSKIFIFLDDAEVHKKNLGYLNRANLIINGHKKYFSVPISKNFTIQKIFNLEFKETHIWKKNFTNLLSENYNKSFYFNETMNLVKEILDFQTNFISDFNINAIKKINEFLDIKTDYQLSSTFKLRSRSSERILDLVKLNNGKNYISGLGGKDYLNEVDFIKEKINIVYFESQIKSYRQNTKNFQFGSSILDMFMNEGIENTKFLINS